MAETRRGWFLALLAGVVAALGQAPFGLWPATLIGLALGFWLIGGAGRARRAAWLGWAFGLGHFALTFIWIVQPFLVDVERHGWMAPFALFFMAGGMALFWAAAGWLQHRLRAGWAGFAIAFGLAELARGHVLTGLPWGGPGLVWIDTPVAQLAAVVGVSGLSVLSFGFAAGLVSALRVRSRGGLAGLAGGGVLAVVAGVWLGAGVPVDAQEVRLRLVQPNAPQHLKWDRDWVGIFFDRAMRLSANPAEGAPPDLVIWPETSIPSLLGQAPAYEASAIASAAPAPLVAGVRRVDGTRIYNSLVVYTGEGAPAIIYDKHHIVPFGEYIPLGDMLARFGIHGLAAGEGDGYSRGPGARLIELPGALGKVLPLICYEAIFPHDLRAAPGRADWILQITNDAWFGTFSGPQQHLAQARFRAIEFRLPFVRAANTGISAVIDARGTVAASLPLGTEGALDAWLPPTGARNLYAITGDWSIIAALALLWALRRVKQIDPARRRR